MGITCAPQYLTIMQVTNHDDDEWSVWNVVYKECTGSHENGCTSHQMRELSKSGYSRQMTTKWSHQEPPQVIWLFVHIIISQVYTYICKHSAVLSLVYMYVIEVWRKDWKKLYNVRLRTLYILYIVSGHLFLSFFFFFRDLVGTLYCEAVVTMPYY